MQGPADAASLVLHRFVAMQHSLAELLLWAPQWRLDGM